MRWRMEKQTKQWMIEKKRINLLKLIQREWLLWLFIGSLQLSPEMNPIDLNTPMSNNWLKFEVDGCWIDED